MPTPTYTAIAKTVLTGTQTDVTFSSIPNSYTDLVIAVSARNTDTGGTVGIIEMRVNSLATNEYSATDLRGRSTSTTSTRNSNASSINYLLMVADGATGSTFSNQEIYIPNYASSANKIVSATNVTENNSASASATQLNGVAGLIRTSAAISSITLIGTFKSGSRFDLYGIKSS